MSFDNVGSLASIVGLVISIGILLYSFSIGNEIKELKRRFIFGLQARKLLKKLEEKNFRILELYDQKITDYDLIKKELIDIKGNLLSVYLRLVEPFSNNSNQIMKKITKLINKLNLLSEGKDRYWYRKKINNYHHNEIFSIYSDCVELKTMLEIYIADKRKAENYAD